MVELTHEDSVIAATEKYTKQSFVFVWLMFPEEVIRFHELLYKAGFVKKGYAFFTFDFANYGMVMNVSTSQLFNMTGLLDITIDSLQDRNKYQQFVSQISSSSDVFPLPCKNRAIGIALNEFADAILLMGHCINLTQERNSSKKCDLINLHNQTFQGVVGDVRIDEDGSRMERLVLNNMVSGCYYQVGWFEFGHGEAVTFNLNNSIIWPGNTNVRPSVKPKCGWKNDECYSEMTNVTAIVVSVVLALIGIGICVFIISRIKARRDLGERDWIISANKLYSAPIVEGKAGAITGSTKQWLRKETKGFRGRLWSLVSQDSFKGFGGNAFTKVAVINGQLVAVKPVMKENLVVTSDITKEINKVRRLKHSNVNHLVGACVETGQVCLVWGYCHKGSLENVLQHTGIKLDVIFNVSFISDIVRGMTYLHDSPVGRHGRLKSSNVLVDSNWSCRITDIAMPFFREGEVRIQDEHQIPCFELLWTAPELLYDVALQRRGTKKGDVYAFAIIMQEIILRSRPFSIGPDDNAREIVQRVRKRESPPFRPVVPRSAADENLQDIMYLCWDDVEQFRPSFPIVSEMIKNVRGGLGPATTLVDQMLHMLSKYADNLEELVEERTTQLEMEQKKTEELLCRMLPKSVAMNLKLGNEVVPESFNAVTIYFSDIVGFTSLAAISTPMQVVDLLNDLYTCFDTIIESFDVYKVETIGDAYMVVSGLPVRNGNLHAGEIATMALKIADSVLTFRIRHLPGEQLNIRIGIHTGPVVAGVVGLKMPRYCLFGDTVNYASRMESTGVAQRVHVSPECKAYLDVLGGYILQDRGPVEMKGKGVIHTYFLIGRVDV
ncbi:atrial natriuretic peptide receptor 1-like isoform X2 [Pomacea canaliculata]|nr:atrial natriuretic peptide receptor 1-like isoform X2 [Pomacea canaliculata]XP_025081507.1 atrial natriuretic peptide receptor 1-like isoform X2 [Pomacea canaliculata]